MDEAVFDNYGVTITRREGRYYVRYDAGAHMIAMREDEITPSEAQQAMLGAREAEDVLRRVQRRIVDAGGDPYRSNID